jgi:hypothetical protein
MDTHPTHKDSNAPQDLTGGGSADFKEAVAKGYEPKDIGLKPVLLFIGGLAATLVVVLFAIFAIMMALADYHRSETGNPSPVAVKLPPVYAPLQPSLGIYNNHDNDHNVLDWQDMQAMRYKADQALHAPRATTAEGRTHEPIEIAMVDVLPVLQQHSKPVAAPTASEVTTYPAGSYEGVYNDKDHSVNRAEKYNDLHRLNDLGN